MFISRKTETQAKGGERMGHFHKVEIEIPKDEDCSNCKFVLENYNNTYSCCLFSMRLFMYPKPCRKCPNYKEPIVEVK